MSAEGKFSIIVGVLVVANIVEYGIFRWWL